MPPKTCTACSLCVNVCPLDAIHLERNQDGVYLPVKDKERCNRCGLCKRMCPEGDMDGEVAGGAAVLAGLDDDGGGSFLQTSPDAVLAALAPSVVEAGGCVYGAAWRGGDEAVFKRACRPGELSVACAYLYERALPGYVYREVQGELKAGYQVLFCGAPCQVHALKVFLRGKVDGLLTMEILCPADELSPAPGAKLGCVSCSGCRVGRADISVRETTEAGAAFVCGLTPKGRAALASLHRC